MPLNYYYILMSQKDFLENQVIEEILRERANHYFLQKKMKDFWIVLSPKFIKGEEFSKKLKLSSYYQKEKKKIVHLSDDNDFFIGLISFNKEFIKWIELRFGYFENLEEKDEKELKDYTSNGIVGKFTLDENSKEKIIPLISDSNYLEPNILKKKYETSLNYFYKKNFN